MVDGDHLLGTVSRLLVLPSCEALEVRPAQGGEPVLVPMVKDAVRSVTPAERRIEINLDFLGLAAEPRSAREATKRRGGGGAVNVDVFTLFPEWFEWFASQRHVTNAIAAGSSLQCVNIRDHTTLSGGQVDDTPFGGGAGMVLRVDVVESALRGRYGVDPVELCKTRRVIALAPGGGCWTTVWWTSSRRSRS